MLLYGLLIADGVLLILVLIAATIRFCKSNKEDIKKEPDEDVILEAQHEVEEVEAAEMVAASKDQPIEEKVEPIVEVKEEIKEEPEIKTEETALVIGDVDEEKSSDKKGIPFAEKMLTLDKNVQDFYDVINNTFLSFRRVHGRVSQKGVSYRLGRDLVAKLSVRGKTLRLNLALETKDFEEKLYFQKDMRDVKSYQDVPFMVKVKSDRGLKRALELIDALSEKEKIEKKARYFPVNSIENLKNLKK